MIQIFHWDIHGRSFKPGASPAESKFYFQTFSSKSIFDSSKKLGRWPAVIQYIAIAHFDFDETTQVGGHGPPPPTCPTKDEEPLDQLLTEDEIKELENVEIVY